MFYCDILVDYRQSVRVEDRELYVFFEDMCVFFGDFNVTTPQRRSSPHTHTHMTGQAGLAGQVVPKEFFSGFANIFGPQVVCKNFF